jgi:hypothetical protein
MNQMHALQWLGEMSAYGWTISSHFERDCCLTHSSGTVRHEKVARNLIWLRIRYQLGRICLWYNDMYASYTSYYMSCLKKWTIKVLPFGTRRPFSRSKASHKIRASWVVSSHPAITNVNRRSKSTAATTFWVGWLFLPRNKTSISLGTEAQICVPSMAPIQS